MAEIRLERVTKLFGDVRAVDDVDLTVGDGEFMVLLGPSGCGKTTLLRSIAGLEQIDTGRVRIGERDVTDLPPRKRRIAMVFQSYAVFPHLSVFENIAFGLRMTKVPKADLKRRVESAAELLHISDLLARYPSQVSGGQRQRIAVARAIAMQPEVLLMDEPLSNLDALLRLEMRAELKRLLRERPNGPVILGIRAENIDVVRVGQGQLTARCLVVEPLGSHNLVTLQLGSALLKATTRADDRLEPDSDVGLRIDSSRIRWLDPDSGEAIAGASPAAGARGTP